jgi:hypothetical protein
MDDRYSGGRVPIGAYAVLMTTYAAGMAAFLVLARRRLPERVDPGDFALMAGATHKLARLVTKGSIASPVRAPFTTRQAPAGAAEVVDRPRGGPLRRAVGELLTCPFCASAWVAGGLGAAFVLAPRAARFVSMVFSAVAASDVLQLLYGAEKKLPELAAAAAD